MIFYFVIVNSLLFVFNKDVKSKKNTKNALKKVKFIENIISSGDPSTKLFGAHDCVFDADMMLLIVYSTC